MKKKSLTLLFALMSILWVSCDKDPNLDKLDGRYIVKTNSESEFDFTSKQSFYVHKEVFVIDAASKDKEKKWVYGEDELATKMIDAIAAEMKANGYTESAELTDDVDFNIMTAYMLNLGGVYYNPWWSYWDSWYGWSWGYYPFYPGHNYPNYPFMYSYKLGSLEIDMIHHSAAPIAEEKGKPTKPIVWSSYSTGLSVGKESVNEMLIMDAIEQSFAQSPYLTKK